jgi:hypothetical protein
MEPIYGEKNFRKNSHASTPLNCTLTNLSGNPTGARKKKPASWHREMGRKDDTILASTSFIVQYMQSFTKPYIRVYRTHTGLVIIRCIVW